MKIAVGGCCSIRRDLRRKRGLLVEHSGNAVPRTSDSNEHNGTLPYVMTQRSRGCPLGKIPVWTPNARDSLDH